MAVLFLGWSIIEGLGAVLVIPAIAALVADNYEGKDRITAFAMIGAVSGAAVAAGPLIGGFVTTYFSWRYVFVAEVVIMAGVVLFARTIGDHADRRVDPHRRAQRAAVGRRPAAAWSSGCCRARPGAGSRPSTSPEINGVPIAPLGISLTAWFIVVGVALLAVFFTPPAAARRAGREPLVHVSMFSIRQLRSGLSVLGAQYTITAGLFFMVPVYLQMTLGLDALETGIRIFPLSVSLILFSIVGTRLSTRVVAAADRARRAVDPRRQRRRAARRGRPGALGWRSASGCSARVRRSACSPPSSATSTCRPSPRRRPARSAGCRACSRTSARRSAPR